MIDTAPSIQPRQSGLSQPEMSPARKLGKTKALQGARRQHLRANMIQSAAALPPKSSGHATAPKAVDRFESRRA